MAVKRQRIAKAVGNAWSTEVRRCDGQERSRGGTKKCENVTTEILR